MVPAAFQISPCSELLASWPQVRYLTSVGHQQHSSLSSSRASLAHKMTLADERQSRSYFHCDPGIIIQRHAQESSLRELISQRVEFRHTVPCTTH